MSEASTPTKTLRDSSASTPNSMRDRSSPAPLTPRSKVQALLKQFDDEWDSDTASKPQDVVINLAETTTTGYRATSIESSKSSPDEDEDEGESEGVSIRPKGRMAARMRASSGHDADKARVVSRESSPIGNAYERVKRQLMEKKTDPVRVSTVNVPATQEVNMSDGSDSGPDTPAIQRRRKLFKAKPAVSDESPESSPSRSINGSPGLIVPGNKPLARLSPSKANAAVDIDSDPDLPADPHSNSRFLELVAKKRRERLAKEAEIAKKREEREAQERALHGHDMVSDQDSADSATEQRLTQQSRPKRKAGKKALEEMNRETQRMARNMQLAHEARTKKKITKQSLFAKFNYKPKSHVEKIEEVASSGERSANEKSGSEVDVIHSTPATSPVSCGTPSQKAVEATTTPMQIDGAVVRHSTAEEASNLPEQDGTTLQQDQTESRKRPRSFLEQLHDETDMAVSSNTNEKVDEERPQKLSPNVKKERLRRLLRTKATSRLSKANESDSDLEIIADPKPKANSVWDKIPQKKEKEGQSMHALRMLANLTSPGKQTLKDKKSLTQAELQANLCRRAREQAAQERAERLQELKDRGIYVQTAEERAKQEAEIEDLTAKARKEAEEIMKREKDDAKKERREKGELDILDEDSDEDEEWQEEKVNSEKIIASDEDDEGEDVIMIDSEEEEDGDDEESENELEANSQGSQANGESNVLDLEASQAGSDEEQEVEAEDGVEEGLGEFIDDLENADDEPIARPLRRSKAVRVISDDEDENLSLVRPAITPVSLKRTVIPGLPTDERVPLGMTQIFMGTADDSQNSPNLVTPGMDKQRDPLSFLRKVPIPSLPSFSPSQAMLSPELIKATQDDANENQLEYETQKTPSTHSQLAENLHEYRERGPSPSATQVSEFPDPSQDVGFQMLSPIADRFAVPPPSTVETVLISPIKGSPTIKKKGRLRRRLDVQVLSDPDDKEVPDEGAEDEFEIKANIFDVMRKTSKEKDHKTENFDKKKSKAKDMVEEHAEESEDEYAGLGGASDDDSANEDAELDKNMIDNEAPDADARELAAFYADKERARDEKQVERLFKDITNGTLRRKRGADYDLSDSDDDGEARRAMKRREFARMRKALLEGNEDIGKIADNPKKAAFLLAIEDRVADDDLNFFEDEEGSNSQHVSESQQSTIGQMKPPELKTAAPLKRKREEQDEDNIENRPPPHLRQTNKAKPSSLMDVRASLSDLIGDRNSMEIENDDCSDEEPQKGVEDNAPQQPRTNPRRTTQNVVDRLALLRENSSSSSNAGAGGATMAFAAPGSTPLFRAPSLLRRATASSTSSSTSSLYSTTERSAGGSEDASVKRGGGKKSSINYNAREMEKKAAVAKSESRRKESLRKMAKNRLGALKGLGGVWG